MSAFYDLASLVLVPSGYKASKVYAQKPLTADGQLTFSRASTATRVNSAGLIETVSSNVPRLDYTNSSCPKLLLEPQRSQLFTYSNDFTNAAWVKSICSFASDTLTGSAGTGFKGINQSNAQNGQQSFYFDVAYTNHQWLQIGFGTGSSDFGYVNYDIQNKVTGAVSGGVIPFIQDFGTFLRIGGTYTTVDKTSVFLIFVDSGNATRADSSTSTGTFKLYRSQLEVGAYPTSFIPSTTAAVTRLADACLTASVPSLIGQTEGTFFVEMTRTNIFERFFVMLSALAGTTSNSYQNSIYLFQLPNGGFVADVWVSNVSQVITNTAALSLGTHKIAIAYKQNDFAIYVDGVQRAVDTSGNVPAMNFLTIAGAVDGGDASNILNQALLFKTRLTNAQLAELTTL